MANQTIQEAATRLQQIVAQMNENTTDERRAQISQELIAFLAQMPWDPEYREIRETGDKIFNELERAITRGSLARIRRRSKELAAHMETISAVTSRAESDAKSLQLKNIRMVIDATTEAVEAIKGLRVSIKSGNLEDAAEKVESAIGTLLRLQREVTKST